MTREDLLRQQLLKLRNNYIKFMAEDLSKGWDLDFVEMDGFQGYLMIKNQFKDIENIEEILDEFGFIVDYNKHTLMLNTTKRVSFSKAM